MRIMRVAGWSSCDRDIKRISSWL